ncbi:hypothetical protein SPRG_02397 [Saprolegnia parasitica CBS 223.65]|uniref:ER membrane protein complex subunit 4 n=1 Tax=Saprolegnia parasitica (strain CBS 223.65) TaxID=695850 RepID=A0A067D113_SAPPC|nr:hypothetical protein SPRG_02397 [Saprolegnia parasitica CBS 223.65]KDO32697.1 hypothetical protein SPRG_02397 [Saprolegnia parasitica CBS 223.65]|eukprot:XP_012196363.1 hypothetical protein SPRG_02397 [Saprolegnia parasitica CBS 223.65]
MSRKWAYDLNAGGSAALEPLGSNKHTLDESHGAVATKGVDNTLELKKKRANEVATAPFKGLFQTGFMMWMSGSSINIFSIMITAMAFVNPVKALFNINGAFAALDDGKLDLLQFKLIFIACNFVAIAVALYKCGTMGLLPTTSSDWTWLLPIKQAVEASAAAVPVF